MFCLYDQRHAYIMYSDIFCKLMNLFSSIVHSEEELAGSYNWDYLLDWGPQYQPLAHVFQVRHKQNLIYSQSKKTLNNFLSGNFQSEG